MTKTKATFMSGVPELLILSLLAREEMYGYQLVRAIRVVSNEAFSLAEGVVYPALHALEEKRLIKAKEREHEGRIRIYYALTSKGKTRLGELTSTWARVCGGVAAVLNGEGVAHG
ncbi:MAG: PadR family transcriptional regulator [Pseudomonadales bacterium]|jgi:PadR family transcriptional regulator PadR|nr:PadR family transcriptional regulator [Pseudomonadales bacterium]